MAPVKPVKFNVVPLPEQIVDVVAVAVPPTDVITLTFAVLLLCGTLPHELVKPMELIVIAEVGPISPLIVNVPVLVVVPENVTLAFAVTEGFVVV
jgi:hypothetical protein